MLVEFHTHLSEWLQLPMGVATLNRGLYGNYLNYFVFPEDYSGVIIILQSFYLERKKKKKNETRMEGGKNGKKEGRVDRRTGGEKIRLFHLIKVEI